MEIIKKGYIIIYQQQGFQYDILTFSLIVAIILSILSKPEKVSRGIVRHDALKLNLDNLNQIPYQSL